MPQLHCYVPQDLAAALKERAEIRGLSVSAYLAELVRRDVEVIWPPAFFSEVVGGWQGEPLARPIQGEPESREALWPAEEIHHVSA